MNGLREQHYLGDANLLLLVHKLDLTIKDKYENLLYVDHMREDEPNWMRMFYREYSEHDDEWKAYVTEGRLQPSDIVPILKDIYHSLDSVLMDFNTYNEDFTETKVLINTLITGYS